MMRISCLKSETGKVKPGIPAAMAEVLPGNLLRQASAAQSRAKPDPTARVRMA
jgi:hypothetical protein